MSIKKSVSLYSFQDKYVRKAMSLEDCVRVTKEFGAQGVELISDQMIHGAPHPSEETVKFWRGLLDKYELVPVCNDIFINSTLYHNRRLTQSEEVELLKAEIKNAQNLGFNLVRLVSKTRPDIVEPALPYAKECGVCMALEIHAGMTFENPLTKEYLRVMKEIADPEYVGIVLDCGIFSRSIPPIERRYFEQFGLNPALADRIDEIYASGVDFGTYCAEKYPYFSLSPVDYNAIPAEFKELILSPYDFDYFSGASGYEDTPFETLDEYMPYVKHIHGKCYEMTEDNREVSLKYPELIAYLKEKDYDGYISTEYEGNRFIELDGEIPDVISVERHQKMLTELIG